jgi:hypothetical protein
MPVPRSETFRARALGWLRLVLALLMMLAATPFAPGCASLGPPYAPLAQVPAGQAVIYFYRPDSVDGSAIVFNVRQGASGSILGELQSGAYFPLVVSPGLHAFWARTETRADVRVIAEAGRSYYVRASLNEGTFVGRPLLEVVSTQSAASEIPACHRAPRGPAR